jgi:exodeoxyribonuclease VII large subunit
VPPLIRNELQINKTITVNGFITRRIVNTSGTIQIQLTVTDLVEQTLNKYSDDEIKKDRVDAGQGREWLSRRLQLAERKDH